MRRLLVTIVVLLSLVFSGSAAMADDSAYEPGSGGGAPGSGGGGELGY